MWLLYSTLPLILIVGISNYAALAQSPTDLTILSSNSYVDSINHLNVVGEVQNNSPSVFDYVQVTGTFYDSMGKVVGTDYTFTSPSSINAAAEAPFHLILSEASIPIIKLQSSGKSLIIFG
jgi:hypothetical protein